MTNSIHPDLSSAEVDWLSHAVHSGKHVWTIPPTIGFIDALADGLLAETDSNPLTLSEITVLLPTRRSARSLRDAFLRRSEGSALILPRLMPLQEIDEDEALLSGFGGAEGPPLDIPPAEPPLSRQILLASLIMEQAGHDGRHSSPDQAARLAQELARLLDEVQTARLSFTALAELVPETLAEHWQVTLVFLRILTSRWPEKLAKRGTIDPAEHRNRVFAAQAKAWSQNPPKGLVVAAGSTGSVPVTRDLLEVVAKLPNGCVILPGLDQTMDNNSWDCVEDSHPQFNLKGLLERLGLGRSEVSLWPTEDANETSHDRQNLISEIMRPAATSEQWSNLNTLHADAIAGIQQIEAPTPREEAAAIALALRRVAEDKDRTGALVTPDRNLARRVSAEMERWNLSVNDSGGLPLSMTPPGVFLRLTAAMVTEDFAPVPLLAALKHPMAAGNLGPPEFRNRARDLERTLLRGPRPPPGMDGLRQSLKSHHNHDPALDVWLDKLALVIAPFAALMEADKVSLKDLLSEHLLMAEHLAASDEIAGPLRLWAGPDGEAVASFLAELADSASHLGKNNPRDYPGLLDAFMEGRVARAPYSSHPRLSILGPLEARLLRPDVLILGGLNEGSWPSDSATDPWMSRPMRIAFGLSPPERRIGQAAHDMAQALGATEVIMTRSLKSNGAPTVASRWWQRYNQVVKAVDIPTHSKAIGHTWLEWSATLTRPESFKARAAPAPTPPVEVRPRRLSVSEIETWMRDPYEIYAKHVLGLRALEPLDADASNADYGTIVHKILQKFVETYPDALPDNAADTLHEIAREQFSRAGLAPAIQAFWQPRFKLIADWFLGEERKRRQEVVKVYPEKAGSLELSGPAGPFKLVAKADRIEAKSDGTLSIVDYKTGATPRPTEVDAGYSPQLPLEVAIAATGGFDGIDSKVVSELLYWKLTGREEGGNSSPAGTKDAGELGSEYLARLKQLINEFDKPNTAYAARPHPERALKYGQTAHLARHKEWASADGDDE